MGTTCSSVSSVSTGSLNEAELKTLKMKFDALATGRSEDGYILKEDFLHLFRIPGLLGERLFVMFDTNRDNKLFWPDFTKGIQQCMFSNEDELDEFIFRFFCLNDRSTIDLEEFQSILQHLPPSVLFVVVKSAENRSSVAQKWVEQFGNQLNELPPEAVQTGIGLLLEAYFVSNDEDTTAINYHAFSIFLREQPSLRDYFRSMFRGVGLSVTPVQSPAVNYNNSQSTTTSEGYQTIPFDCIDPAVYKTRNNRSIEKLGHPEKWQGFTRAYWCIVCKFCHKEVRFCCMCQGELKPVDNEKKDGVHHLECTECHRVISMRFCSACGHQFEDTVVDARMEIPGINSEVKEMMGELYQTSHFNSMNKVFARIHNNFLYLFADRLSKTPLNVSFLEKVVVKKMVDDKNPKYFGFVLQFPAAYEKYLYCLTSKERDVWIKTIEDVSGVRKIEDYYDIREKIGEGRFATVYRCVDKKSLKEYAVKVINKENLTDKERELIQTEIAILSLVQHKRIVTLIETFEAPKFLYIVMEWLRGGELYQNICGRSILSEEEAYQIVIPLAECLSYMHKMGIIHRDIKPENILCDKNLYDVKIADFGFSKLIFPKEKLDYPCGTLNYIAPEVITRQGYTTKADMWSLGIIFYLLMRGRLPFDGKSKEEVLDQVIHGIPDYNNKAFIRLSNNCKNVIKGLLQKNPDLRLSAEDLLNHPWVMAMKKKIEEKSNEEQNPETTGNESKEPEEDQDLSDASDWVKPEKETSIPAVVSETISDVVPCTPTENDSQESSLIT